MNARTLLHLARQRMKPEEIHTSDAYGSDLFLKVTPISTELIAQYDFKENVKKFYDAIDHELWYELPFANVDWWFKRGCYCGELQI